MRVLKICTSVVGAILLRVGRRLSVGMYMYRELPRRAQFVLAALVMMVSTVPASLLQIHTASANSVGPNSPTLGTSTAGAGTTWTSPTNIYTSNSVYASASLAAGATSYNLNATGFGFNINSAAIINGVTASVVKYTNNTSTRASIQDNNVMLLKANTAAGTSQATTADWPTARAAVAYGDAASLWGTTLTASDINNAGFGVTVSAKNVKTSGSGATASAFVDYISITVTYTLNAVMNQASYRLYANQDAAATTTLGFAGKVDYGTGTNPNSVATADLDGDGKLDMAVGNYGNASISVLLGNGDGSFAGKVDYTTGANPESVKATDLNGDGKLDLIVANASSASISVLLGNGDGSFAGKVDYSVGSAPQSVTAADLNGDGKLDLAVTNYSSSTISILLGNGDGSFATNVDYAASSNPNSVVAADLNGDGKLELAVSNYGSSTISVFQVNADGTLAANTDYSTGLSPNSVVAADMNSDGRLDLASSNYNGGSVSVLIANSIGGFASKVDYSSANPQSVTAADLNGDSKIDLITSGYFSNVVSVFAGNGDGSFASRVDYPTGLAPSFVAVADWDGNGKNDLAASNYNGGTVSVLLAASGPINVGTPLAAQNTAATVPADGQVFRMRMNIGITLGDNTAGGQAYKLQYAPMTTSCDTSFTNTANAAYADVTAVSPVSYYDNLMASNGVALTTNANDPTDGTNTTANGGVVPQSYQEKGTTTFTNTTTIPVGKDGMWDFALTTSGTTSGQNYCLRMVKDAGNLNSYATIARITASGAPVNAPNAPANLIQNKIGGTAIATGGWTNGSGVAFAGQASAAASDTLQLCVEKKPLGTAFAGTEDLCGTGTAYSTMAVNVAVTISNLADATQYHWQARVKGSSGTYSAWVAYGGNAETAADFGVDRTAPTGITVYDGLTFGTDISFNDGSLSTLSANWSGINANVSGFATYEVSMGTVPGTPDIMAWLTVGATYKSIISEFLKLQTSKMYYVNVRATDNAGNSSVFSSNGQMVAPTLSFTVAPASVVFANLNNGNAYTDTQTSSLMTSTNAYGGYVVRMFAPATPTAANGKTIGMFNGGTYAAPAAWAAGNTGFGYTSSDTNVQGTANKFGTAGCTITGTPSGCLFAPFSQTAKGDVVADNTGPTSGTPTTNEQFTLTYRVTAPPTQAATKYSTSVVYSVTPVY